MSTRDFDALGFDPAPGEPEKITDALFTSIREDTVDEWMADNPELINKD